MENVSVSQLMSETEIIDILFRTCDSGNLGSVPVSSLIKYIERVTDMHQKNTEAVKVLTECLDPFGLDANVDIETYREGMHMWFARLGHSRTSFSDANEEVAPQNKVSNMQVAVFSPHNKEFGFLSVTPPAAANCHSEEYHARDRDSEELEERVEDLQNTVRRQSQINSNLQAQVDVYEDCITALNQEKGSLLERIHRLQETVDLQSEIAAENEELKAALGRCQDHITDLNQTIQRKDKENASLADQLAQSEVQLSKATSAEETSHQVVENLQASIQYLTGYLQDIFEAKKSQEVELANELKENNKELLLRFADQQLNLNSLQQQLMQQSQRELSAAANSPSRDTSDQEDEDLSSRLGSTPASTQPSSCASIHSEIQQLRQADVWQLPLCGKEQTETLGGHEAMDFTSEEEKALSSVVQHLQRSVDCFLSAIADDGLDLVASPRSGESTLEEILQSDRSDNSSRSSTNQVPTTDTNVFDRNAKNAVNFRLKKLFALIKGLKDENERLRHLYDSVMNNVLCDRRLDDPAFTHDSRVVILRDLLLEERTQKVQLQQQVKFLKRKYGLSNNDPAGDFGEQQNLFALQLQKIHQLERSSLLLAEKYHKAELQITDLQEEALRAAFNLETEKRRCAKLEDSLSTSTLARQLDLRDIWRLVQKDVETEYLDNQEDSGMSTSTEELKEKILQDIKAMRDEINAQHETCYNLGARNPFGSPKKPCSHFKTRTRSCGISSSPSSPLVDALTIDLFDGNYSMRRKSPVSDPYLNYLRMSCEDVDCMACRAVRLGLEFHGMSSCPSLQLKFAHDCIGFNEATTDYNFNSQTSLPPNVPNTSMYSRQLPHRQNANVPAMVLSPAAQHRRLEFVRCCEHWTSGTTDSLTSNSIDSNSSNASSARLPPPGTPFCGSSGSGHGEHASREQGKAVSGAEQSSPSGFRRMSFLAAVEKSKGQDGQQHRRPSYRAAIDRGFLGLNGRTGGDEQKMMHVLADPLEARGLTDGQQGGQTSTCSRTENKSVTFQLAGDHGHALCRATHQHVTSEPDADSAATCISVTTPPARATGGQVRKLSILVEEDGEDISRSPDRMSPSYSQARCSSSLRNHVSTGLDRYDVSESGHCAHVISSTDTVTTDEQRFPTAACCPVSHDAGLVTSEPSLFSLGAAMKGGDEAGVCGDDRMPAHFRQNSITGRVSVDAAAAPASPHTSVSEPTVTTPGDNSFVLVPDSPPQTPRLGHEGQAVQDGPPSRLAKLRQSNLAKKREQMKTMKMPELSEHAEADARCNAARNSPCPAAPSSDHSAAAHANPTRFSLTPEDEEVFPSVDGSNVLKPPSPSGDPVTPSIPDSFLKQLGLSTSDLEMSDSSIDQLPDKELESRFTSLSLAFKTDRLTLDKRLGIQERSRDLTEENIDKELRGLKEAVEALNQLCSDEQVKDIIFKIQHHLNILETSVARLSGRAEVFGAVQQEKRMSRAMEVMITHTENIRRLREKEQSEVEEARKILIEKSQNTTAAGLDLGGLDRRSASVSAALNNPRLTQRARSPSPCLSSNPLTQRSEKMDANSNSDARRRSEVVLPRCLGGTGSPPLTVSSSMDSGVYGDFLHQGIFSTSRQAGFENGEEPRQRFQSATANVTVRNVVTSTLRNASLERQKRFSQNSSSSSQFSRGNSSDQSLDKDQPSKVNKQHSQEEEAYRQGYEEGLKASLGRELGELRDQQTTISSSLEHIMDRVDTMQMEEHKDEMKETMARVKDALGRLRMWTSSPNWPSASITFRHLLSGLMFFLALLVVLFTFTPLILSSVTMRSDGPNPH